MGSQASWDLSKKLHNCPPEVVTRADVETPTEASPETTTTMPTAEETTPLMTSAATGEPTGNNEVEVLSTQAVPDMAAEITVTDSSLTTETVQSSDNLSTETEGIETTTSATVETSTIDVASSITNDTNLETLQRRKKSIVDFLFSHPPYVDDYLIYKAYEVPVVDRPKPYEDNMFLVNGLSNVPVTYMHYDTVLEHAYLPHLEASALRLPLDSDRYYLLVILPTRGGSAELGRLLGRMARESDLSDVYAVLRPRRVRAVVPSFTVKGHITLTTDLQKFGIRDVFEPRQRDFAPMTRQPGVYVRSVEQSVSVAIRKYRAADHNTSRGYVSSYPPVTFSATYPFVYFVMDASIHVALMAGKMVDPLNSRIL